MSRLNEITLPVQVGDISGILFGIDQNRYLDAIRNSCASLTPADTQSSHSITKIFLYTRPEYVLAMALNEGKSPYSALNDWHEAVGIMLSEYRKLRRESILIEVVSAMKHCKLDLNLDSSAINLALASLAVFQSFEIKSTLDELTASSIPLKGWNLPPLLDLHDTASQYHQVQEQIERFHRTLEQNKNESDKHRAGFEDATESNKELAGENQNLQDQVKRLQDKSSRLSEEQNQLKKHLAGIENQRDALNVECKVLREENEMLLMQLHKVQEDLELNFLQQQGKSIKESEYDTQEADSVSQTLSVQPQPSITKSRRSTFIRKVAALKRLRAEAALLNSSPLFDSEWYLRCYPDVASAKMDPARHYLRFGAAEGRNPGPDFNTVWYLQEYPDVAESGINPLVHYLKYGKNEGRVKTEWSWN